MNKVRIGKMAMCSTPTSAKQIEDWILLHPEQERANMFIVMGMTWNLLSQTVTDIQDTGGDSLEHLEMDNPTSYKIQINAYPGKAEYWEDLEGDAFCNLTLADSEKVAAEVRVDPWCVDDSHVRVVEDKGC
jgi:hypothetical protein